SLSKILDTV
nr:Chain C, SER-LEU-SER-LYS-ILE-LEU-ASP-THR-VAL [Homo sapiens]